MASKKTKKESGIPVAGNRIGEDAFEKEDNDYWLPDCCFTDLIGIFNVPDYILKERGVL